MVGIRNIQTLCQFIGCSVQLIESFDKAAKIALYPFAFWSGMFIWIEAVNIAFCELKIT